MNNSITVLKKEECFGCRSCEQICPQNCISILPDTEGFLYPQINSDLCINCGLCLKHCPSVCAVKHEGYPKALGLKLKDEKELSESASGGVFAGVANYIIENKGVVFGCAFNDNLQAQHIKVESKEVLKSLKGSKYVTSNTLQTYKEVSATLKSNPDKLVFYSGTPCQIHGLYSFLGFHPENLLTADIICHGVPSQKLFDKYIKWLSLKLKGEITYIGFRDKDISGWTCKGKAKTKFKTKKIYGAVDPYYSSFLYGNIYRHSCYQCPFTDIKKRAADITMGDFWGIENINSKFYSSKGVSCCLLNSEKGKMFFEKVRNNYESIETTIEDVTIRNYNLLRPTKKPPVRDTIYNGIDDMSIEKYIKKLYAPLPKRVIRFIISVIPENIKILIKRILH
jgi:coenzyme F420-reducing hydrogenase beta subunit